MCCRRQHQSNTTWHGAPLQGVQSPTNKPNAERLKSTKCDIFDLIEKSQSSRLDDQRCVLPAYFNQVRFTKMLQSRFMPETSVQLTLLNTLFIFIFAHGSRSGTGCLRPTCDNEKNYLHLQRGRKSMIHFFIVTRSVFLCLIRERPDRTVSQVILSTSLPPVDKKFN